LLLVDVLVFVGDKKDFPRGGGRKILWSKGLSVGPLKARLYPKKRIL
jgi:hypothetical protein